MKIKTLILFFLIFITNTFVFSQNTFIYSEKDSITDDLISNAIELPNGEFILLGTKEKFEDGNLLSQDILLIKLNSKGELLSEKRFNPEGYPSIVNNIIRINSNSFLLVGNITIDTTSKLLLVKTDSSFNVIESKIVSIPGYDIWVSFLKTDHSNNFLIYGEADQKFNEYPNYPFIYKFSNNLDSVRLKVLNKRTDFSIEILEKKDSSGYYLFAVTYSLVGREQIFTIDTSFSILQDDPVPLEVFNFCNAKWISDSKFILTGHVLTNEDQSIYKIKALVLDTSFSVVHDNQYGTPGDTTSVPAFLKNLDFYYPNEIYIGGIYFYGAWLDWYPVNSWFILNSADTTLEMNWQKYYGGDKNYGMYGILATKDSGCLMYGASYDWQKNDEQRDIYAIKVNKKGLLLSTGSPLQEIAKDAIVYPNPGSNYLVIQSGPQVSGAEFRMLSINGMQVVSKKLTERKVIVNTQAFSSGTYVWQLILSDRVVETGKWIKD